METDCPASGEAASFTQCGDRQADDGKHCVATDNDAVERCGQRRSMDGCGTASRQCRWSGDKFYCTTSGKRSAEDRRFPTVWRGAECRTRNCWAGEYRRRTAIEPVD